jgi:hypothetical protein
MATKKISDLTLRSDFDATCNLPSDDATQTWRVTGAQMLAWLATQLGDNSTIENNSGVLRIKAGALSADTTGRAKMADGFLTQAKMAARATGSSVAAGGVATSSSCGSFSGGAGTFADITNLAVTLVTTGRPVQLLLIPDGSANNSALGFDSGGYGNVAFLRSVGAANSYSEIMRTYIEKLSTGAATWLPPGIVSFVDFPAAGTWDYKARYKNNTANFNCTYVKMLAYEL